jgi:hypothetical protein
VADVTALRVSFDDGRDPIVLDCDPSSAVVLSFVSPLDRERLSFPLSVFEVASVEVLDPPEPIPEQGFWVDDNGVRRRPGEKVTYR